MTSRLEYMQRLASEDPAELTRYLHADVDDHAESDALRELASDMAARMVAAEGICEMGILDVRFERRMHELGIEVER